MADAPLPRLRTPGVIARELGKSLSRVHYVLRTRAHIRPTALAGRLRLYDRRAVAMVRHELNVIDARRGGKRRPMHADTSAVPKLLPTPPEAARPSSASQRALWDLTTPRGPNPAIYLGRSVRCSLDALRRWIAESEGKVQP